MAEVHYVGDRAMMPGPVFAETPFNYAWKGADLFNYGHWLKDAIVRGPAPGGERAGVGDFYRLAPGRYEQILNECDVLVAACSLTPPIPLRIGDATQRSGY